MKILDAHNKFRNFFHSGDPGFYFKGFESGMINALKTALTAMVNSIEIIHEKYNIVKNAYYVMDR